MPRIFLACALVLSTGGCVFDADYREGTLRCSDDRCPAYRPICHAGTCVSMIPVDAAPDDAPPDVMIDARIAALTCADPGLLPVTGGSVMGSTLGKFSRVAANCAGFVMNGADDVYRIDVTAGAQLLVEIEGGREAYVLATCSPAPATPMCVGNVRATMDNPISVAVTGPSYVVVDGAAAVPGGPYTLTVTIP